MLRLIGSMAAMAALVLPPFLAKMFADTLDLRPYLECFAAGSIFGISAFLTMAVLARRGVAGLGPSRVLNWALAVAALAPTWTVGAGLGANRWLDRSPAVEHETRILKWETFVKSPARCRVSSWRGGNSEGVTRELIAAGEATLPPIALPDAMADGAARFNMPYPRACVPGNRLIVASHRGALGWEWIERVRVP